MKRLLGALIPHKLKYRLFAAFVILILLPIFILNIYNYNKIEKLIQTKISQQSHMQLENLHRALQDQMSVAVKTLIFLEQDLAVRSTLIEPKQDRLDNIYLIEEKFQVLNNSLFLNDPSVYFTVLDFHGHYYNSYRSNQTLDYDVLRANPSFQEIMNTRDKYKWVPNDDNYVFRDISTSPTLLSLYAVISDRNLPIGLVRTSIDFAYWFQSSINPSFSNQQYFVITGNGGMVTQSDAKGKLPATVLDKVTTSPKGNGYLIDNASHALINYRYIESLDWYMVNLIPLDLLFEEIYDLKKSYYVTFSLFTVAFMIIAFMIAVKISRPLSFIQAKMNEAIRKDFRLKLPEKRYKGEILELTRTFNTLLADMNQLIQRLKEEKSEKDVVHFQMLLSQTNPHFLLNTLNTIKWIALRYEQTEITEMCISLGKLLETSLNSEMELIYLKDEIDLIRAYVYIQQIRYKHSFEVHYDYEESNEYVLVPKLSLQPLVENAIQHGIANITKDAVIQIRVRNIGQESLVIEVEDNGVGFEEAIRNQTHRKRPKIGLENIKQRLRLLFKDKGVLEIVHLGRGTLVRLKFPCLLSTPYENESALKEG